MPIFDLEEVAFFGRSNSGKSTLLNVLLGRKNLAKSSSTPGRTQMVNFFKVELGKGTELIFADFPGFGYSKAAKKIEKNWEDLIDHYVTRQNIKCFLFLADVRRELSSLERRYINFLGQLRPTYFVLTKADKVNRAELQKRLAAIAKENLKVTCHVVSCLKKTGIEELRQLILPQPSQE